MLLSCWGEVVLGRNSIYATIILTVIWMILRESIAISTVVAGFAISAGCLFLCHRLLPLPNMAHFHPLRLILYLFYLVGQVYIAGFSAIKIMLTDAHAETVEVRTTLTDKFLRTILVNSITLVPGSVSLDLQDDKITVLWLMKKTMKSRNMENADELLKGKLERMLLKAQK